MTDIINRLDRIVLGADVRGLDATEVRAMQDAKTEIIHLREIVERLPVTADGVRVVPGDTVLWLRIGPRGGVRIERVKVGCEGEIGTWWCSDNCNSMGDEWELLQDSLANCYSTREAAEAALAEQQRDAAVAGLNAIEDGPTDYRVGSDENMERVRKVSRDTLARIRELGER